MDSALAQTISNYLAGQLPAMLQLLQQLVLAESPSLAPEAQTPVLDALAGRLQAIGFATRRITGRRSGGMLFARPAQRQPGAPAQLMIGHTDTVWPVGALNSMPLLIDGDHMAGPGVYDMKSGLVQIIFALQAIHGLDLRPSVTPLVFMNSDEEIGSPESRRYIQRLAQVVERAFILEPGLGLDGRLKTARKGVMRFEVTVAGKAAHAGLAPQEGVSAILELSHIIQALFALNDLAHGVTVNVGVVTGGTRPNVVAAQATAQVDVRVPTAVDGQRVAEAILGLAPTLPGATVQMRLLSATPPLELTPRNQQLWRTARDLGQLLGLSLDHGTVGGASDGNTTSQFTATLDGLGAIGGGAHARHEFICTDKLVERTALLALLLLAPPWAG
jgi:glutamate carboxypeptidase